MTMECGAAVQTRLPLAPPLIPRIAADCDWWPLMASLIRYKRAEKSNPRVEDLHNNLALLYADSGRLAAALATWQVRSPLMTIDDP